jgi:CheY-like chemotaxis protein
LQAIECIAQEQRRRAEEAERYQKEQEDFIDMVCHEIRNPIMGILGNLDFIKQNTASLNAIQVSAEHQKIPEEFFQKQTENIHDIERCVWHQKTVVDNVIDLARLESGKLILDSQPFYPKTIIKEIMDNYKTLLAAKQLALEITAPETECFVKSDTERLKSVLNNLMAYVITSTDNGTIKIGLTLENKDNLSTLMIRIEDSSPGMTLEEQESLFQRFSKSASANYENSHLGLIISKRLIERMGGQLLIISKKGIGTQWIVKLPCEPLSPQERLALLAENKPPPQSPSVKTKNILIVEDNVMNQKIISRHLEHAGHSYLIANNGQEAVEACEKNAFDLILMDIEMPIMNGITATKEIRRQEQKLNRAQTPIIALSAYEYQQQAFEAGMNDYLTKPYRKDILNQKIETFTTKPLLDNTPRLAPAHLTSNFFIRNPNELPTTESLKTLTQAKTSASATFSP